VGDVKIHPLLHDRTAGLSSVAARMLRKAAMASVRGEFDAAFSALNNARALAPNHVEVLRVQGMVEQKSGNPAAAATALRQALQLKPRDALVLMNLATTLHELGKVDEAVLTMQRASQMAPDFAPVWFNYGRMLKLQQRYSGALTALHRAVDVEQGYWRARLLLAEVQTSLGAISEATANYRLVLQAQPHHAEAWLGLTNLKTEPFDVNDLAQLKQALSAPHVHPPARIALNFALAKAHEDQLDYASAFEALRRGNALKREQVSWDAQAARTYTDAIRSAFPESLDGTENARLGEEVIFITCLPRSGAALTEQILASHPQVEGADELPELQRIIEEESGRRGQAFPQWTADATPEDWERMGREYLARTERWRLQRPRFTDKSLINWRLVGAAMAMLPGARVINSRRDPVENCFSCYRHLFATGSPFTYDLEEMASYWRDYDRLSRHWKMLFPHQFYEHSYEALLADPEAQIRRLLEFCGLEFDPACIDFHRTRRTVRTLSAAQVRQPLQQRVELSALYDGQLERLRKLLGVGDPAIRLNLARA
jgi:tetratricopeptide (TPR) repeat protein